MTASDDPDLAVIVLSLRAPAELEQAVASLLRQSAPVEILVVNSGGGDPWSRLPVGSERVKVCSSEKVLWPGAARNLGIKATRAPWIAFLAADCRAEENWAAFRLKHHRSGRHAVASAVVNSHPRNLYAWASYLSVYALRMPGCPGRKAVRYGVSYSRLLFTQHGLFRADLRMHEDREFNSRIRRRGARPVWAPEIRTIHNNPTTFREMVRDQFIRGRRQGIHGPQLEGSLISRSANRFLRIVRMSRLGSSRDDLRYVVLAWPLLAVCIGVYTIGLFRGRRLRRDQASAAGAAPLAAE